MGADGFAARASPLATNQDAAGVRLGALYQLASVQRALDEQRI